MHICLQHVRVLESGLCNVSICRKEVKGHTLHLHPEHDTHLCPLYSQGEPRPSSCQVSHFEGSRLLGPTSGSWVGVVEDDPLGTILNLGQCYTQVYNLEKKNIYLLIEKFTKHEKQEVDITHLLVGICNGKQHPTMTCGGLSCDRDGKVIEERVGDK